MSASHGNTPAAWTAVTIMFVGALVSAIALPVRSPVLFFVGFAVIAAGLVAGKVMQMMGMGSTVTYKDAHHPDYEHHSDDAAAAGGQTAAEPDESQSSRP